MSSQPPPQPSPPTTTTTSPDPAASSTPPSQPQQPPGYLTNDPKRTGYDPSLAWYFNYFRILTGRVTREGIEHYREDRYKANEARDCARCEADRDWLFQHSPVVRYLREKAAALNGDLGPHNVVCRRCPGRIAEDGTVVRQTGGFSPDHGILLCANEFRDRSHLEDTLAHEMVHAWDHLRWKVDWMGGMDLKHAACTEVRLPRCFAPFFSRVLNDTDTLKKQIRASMLSGECRWTRETITRGNWTLTQQFQNCVRMRAIQSVMNRPTCKDDVQATKVVNQVWDSCFNDKRPFEEIYR
ncbi:uncharacterized protein PODANS_7_8510 [Podospora anserina S mat+]|uniref:Mitochondrial inner membrane protease ATP23 n=1 Tax=Podospora anserina (strain S / ATCC MYA-4624 / DSM 980 / FGSC 10383) TaxID=515849 RepID=B2AWW1_PODAN|nr:uncharacterized protein PODANS_7_8510 [Podospora anserina S mat+]CAP68885.1 unnamed protein product [Podospora anserina S mat+]CDP32357.1 Putative metalloprotease ATP23 [Podospora anserina S mat+]